MRTYGPAVAFLLPCTTLSSVLKWVARKGKPEVDFPLLKFLRVSHEVGVAREGYGVLLKNRSGAGARGTWVATNVSPK